MLYFIILHWLYHVILYCIISLYYALGQHDTQADAARGLAVHRRQAGGPGGRAGQSRYEAHFMLCYIVLYCIVL